MLPILTAGSIGTAAAGSVPSLLAWRVVQAFGASGGFSVGAGVIADAFSLEQRGRATGIFFSVRLPLYLLRTTADGDNSSRSLVQHSHLLLVVR